MCAVAGVQQVSCIAQGTELPDDVVQAAHEREAAQEAHRALLWLADLPAGFVVDDGPLARALAGLGRLVEERESARGTELQARHDPLSEASAAGEQGAENG